MAKVIIPTPLRKFTENQPSLETSGGTVMESMVDLAQNYPDLKKHLFDETGNIRNFVRIYLGDEDIKALNNGETQVDQNSVISIIPAIAGGIQ